VAIEYPGRYGMASGSSPHRGDYRTVKIAEAPQAPT
jgi:hypothetical protein